MLHEPKECKVISEKGKKTLQVVSGADRENITITAACSAAGKVIPPFIISPGQQVQLAWRSSIKDPDKFPWLDANTSGWMDGNDFYKSFKLWEQKTQKKDNDGNIEPRLLIYDGHQ